MAAALPEATHLKGSLRDLSGWNSYWHPRAPKMELPSGLPPIPSAAMLVVGTALCLRRPGAGSQHLPACQQLPQGPVPGLSPLPSSEPPILTH